MKSYRSLILAFLGTLAVGVLNAEEVIQIHPRFDSGRLRTNTFLDGQGFNQWTNGTGANWANNVGWNPEGIWYSFIRVIGPRFEGPAEYGMDLAELFGKMNAAGQIILRGDVVWLERNPDFPVAPGVDIAVYLVPGLNIPEGQLPTFANTWPWNYPDAMKVASVPTSDMIPLRANFNAAEASPVTQREQLEYNLQIDLTAGIRAAIESGALTASTTWGIIFFPEEMENQLNVPNNPQWVDRRGTVLSGAFWEFVLTEGDGNGEPPPPTRWAGFEIESSGWVYTGEFLGWIYPQGDFVFALDFEGWLYLPENLVSESGSWAFIIR